MNKPDATEIVKAATQIAASMGAVGHDERVASFLQIARLDPGMPWSVLLAAVCMATVPGANQTDMIAAAIEAGFAFGRGQS